MHALHGETEGNPFFIEEVVRHMRDTARRRWARRSTLERGRRAGRRARGHRAAPAAARRADAREALLVASVIGREFDFDVLEAVVGR